MSNSRTHLVPGIPYREGHSMQEMRIGIRPVADNEQSHFRTPDGRVVAMSDKQEQLERTARMLEAAGLRVTRQSVTDAMRGAASNDTAATVAEPTSLTKFVQQRRADAETEAEERNASRGTSARTGGDSGQVPPSRGLMSMFRL